MAFVAILRDRAVSGASMRLWAFAAISLFAASAGAADPAGSEGLGAASAEALVKLLESPNPAPDRPMYGDRPELPKGFDKSKQDRIYLVWNELERRDAKDVLPAIVSQLDNQKYSCTHDYNGFGYRNYFVADVCWEILIRKLNRYTHFRSNGRDLRMWRPPDYVRDFLVDKKGAEEWLSTRREKSWRELQIESFEYFLKKEKEGGFENEALVEGYRRVEKALQALKDSDRPIWLESYKPYSRF